MREICKVCICSLLVNAGAFDGGLAMYTLMIYFPYTPGGMLQVFSRPFFPRAHLSAERVASLRKLTGVGKKR